MRWSTIPLFVMLTLLAGEAAADRLLGLYGGIGGWSQSYSGTAAAGGEAIDIEGDLDLSSKGNRVIYLALEHPVPVLPNLRVESANLVTDGSNVLTRDFDWQGASYTASESVATDIAIDQTDLVMYYELLDNVVSLDLGIAGRYMDGSISVESPTASGVANFKGLVPMLYGRARFDLPLTGTWLSARAQGIGYDGHSLLDLNFHLGWESKIGLGVEAGWRSTRLDLDEIDELSSADMRVQGPYAALNFHF